MGSDVSIEEKEEPETENLDRFIRIQKQRKCIFRIHETRKKAWDLVIMSLATVAGVISLTDIAF